MKFLSKARLVGMGLVICFCSFASLFGQSSFCKAPHDIPDSIPTRMPWFGDETFLPHFLDSLGYGNYLPNAISKQYAGGPSDAWITIPIKANIVHGGNLFSLTPKEDVYAYIKALNESFLQAQIPIAFYLKCDIGTINDPLLHEQPYPSSWDALTGPYREDGALNIFFVWNGSGNYLGAGAANSPPNTVLHTKSEGYPSG